MANWTKEQLISDIILRVTKGKPSDDLELEPRQVAFWIDQFLGALIQETLNAKILQGMGIDPSYIKTEDCVAPKIKKLDCRDCQDNVYIDLCFEPLSLFRDRGVIRVATEDGDWVDKVSLTELDNLRKLRFSRPSLKNIKYHRVKQTLYIHGLSQDTYHLAKFNISYVPVQKLADLKDTDPIFTSDEILPILAEKVEALARRQMYEGFEDLENDGQQDLNQK